MRTFGLCARAVKEALSDASLKTLLDGTRVGVCLGTTVACQLNDLAFYRQFRAEGEAPMAAVDRFLSGNLADATRRSIGANGPCATVVNACSSSAEAIGIGVAWIQHGLCDVVVAGGADELNHVPFCGFHSLGIMSPEPCRPFDKNRKGLNLGEGAGIVILESTVHAQSRGHRSDLRLAGYGSACDAYHLTAPRPDGAGLEQAIQMALKNADITTKDIAFVNAHGTATPENDRVEGSTLARIFSTGLKAFSTKGYTGHTLGAAGGIETILTALALRAQTVPCSAGFATLDEEVVLAPVCENTPVEASFALSTSLAFGGNNSALIIALDSGY